MKVGVIDIGTNSVRMLIVEKTEKPKILDSHLVTTRLGQGMTQTGRLSKEALKRTLAALGEFKEYSLKCHLEKVILIATSAVREASNKEVFLKQVRSKLDWDIDVIPGEREALLGFTGVVKGLPEVPPKPLVIDIGGGSTELIWALGEEIQYTSSLVGAVRMTEKNSSRGEILEALRPVLSKIGRGACENAVGIGGTATTLAAIDQELLVYQPEMVHGYKISLDRIQEIYHSLAACDLAERKQIKGLQPERADIILAGISILEVILSELGIDQIAVSETDIMYGRALKYFEEGM